MLLRKAQRLLCRTNYAHRAYKKPKTSTDPDTLDWNRAMSSSFKSQFMDATIAEVEQLTKKGTWYEYPYEVGPVDTGKGWGI